MSFSVDVHAKVRQAAQSAEAARASATLAAESAMLSKRAKKKSSNMIDIEPVQGCRDFPPAAMRKRNFLFDTFHDVAKSFGFQEYDAPVLESEELYIRKAGEEITEQMFNFVTKSNHRVALRPEMTPTLARLVLAQGQAMQLPVKWYSIPQCWRFETITRGRRREHYQWNMDIVGAKSTAAEAELVCALCTTMSRLGLTSRDVGIKINSRKILQSVIQKAGVPDDKFAPVCVIVDKMEKLPREEVERMLSDLGLSASIVDVISRTLSIKNLEDVSAALGGDHPALGELRAFFGYVEAYGFGDWVQFDASVVRGLAYYTGIVFEGFDREGKLRAICGGGRYDGLLQTYGSPLEVPCCGFGFGDCVIMELLEEKKLVPVLEHTVADVVIPFDESMKANAFHILRRLRDAGRVADIVLDKKKVAQSFAYADRVGAVRAVLVAPDEWARGEVTIKMLREGTGKVNNTDTGERGRSIPIAALLD